MHGPGHQDLSRLGGGHHPRGDVHTDAAHVARISVSQLDLAGVEPGAELDPQRSYVVGERARAADRPRQAIEGGQDAVAGGLDQPATKGLDPAASRLVVQLQQFPPALIPQLSDPVGWSPRCQ